MYLKNSEQQFVSKNGTMYADYVFGAMTYEEYYRNEIDQANRKLEQLNKEIAEEKQMRKQLAKELIELVEKQNDKELLELVKKILSKERHD